MDNRKVYKAIQLQNMPVLKFQRALTEILLGKAWLKERKNKKINRIFGSRK